MWKRRTHFYVAQAASTLVDCIISQTTKTEDYTKSV